MEITLSDVTSIITLLAVAYVGYIQQTQIKSMKEVFKLYDVEKLRAFVKIHEETTNMRIPKIVNGIKDMVVEDFAIPYGEALAMLTVFVGLMPRETRSEWMKKNIPLSQDKITEALEKYNL